MTARTIRTARQSNLEEIYVYSDGWDILDLAREEGAVAVKRPKEVSGDETTSEESVQRFLQDVELPGKVELMLLQCTTPFLKPSYIDQALEKFQDKERDSVVAVTPVHRYLGYLSGIKNTNDWVPMFPNRWLRQEAKPLFFMENGAFYLATKSLWNRGRRMGPKCGIVIMPWWESIEIDDPLDLRVAQNLSRLFDRG